MYVPIPVVYLNLPEASVHHHYYGFYYKSLCHLQILREHYDIIKQTNKPITKCIHTLSSCTQLLRQKHAGEHERLLFTDLARVND